MQFDDDANLDTSQIEDSRGSRGGGRNTGMKIGGGAGILVVIVALIFGISPDQLGLSDGGGGSSLPADNQALDESCRTGKDANARDDCRIVGVVNSAQAYWSTEFTNRGGR
jgi:predicted metalloprotease